MFYIVIRNTKKAKWEYAHKDTKNIPYFGTLDDAFGFTKVDDAINWFGRQRHRLMENMNVEDYEMESVRVVKVSHSNRQPLRW